MPPIVTSSAMIKCVHGGQVTLMPRQTSATIDGAPILCEPDLMGATIAGCMQPTTSTTKQCTTVVSTTPGSTSLKVTVCGKPAYIATLSGVTDSIPPGALVVSSPGQTTVQG